MKVCLLIGGPYDGQRMAVDENRDALQMPELYVPRAYPLDQWRYAAPKVSPMHHYRRAAFWQVNTETVMYFHSSIAPEQQFAALVAGYRKAKA